MISDYTDLNLITSNRSNTNRVKEYTHRYVLLLDNADALKKQKVISHYEANDHNITLYIITLHYTPVPVYFIESPITNQVVATPRRKVHYVVSNLFQKNKI